MFIEWMKVFTFSLYFCLTMRHCIKIKRCVVDSFARITKPIPLAVKFDTQTSSIFYQPFLMQPKRPKRRNRFCSRYIVGQVERSEPPGWNTVHFLKENPHPVVDRCNGQYQVAMGTSFKIIHISFSFKILIT